MKVFLITQKSTKILISKFIQFPKLDTLERNFSSKSSLLAHWSRKKIFEKLKRFSSVRLSIAKRKSAAFDFGSLRIRLGVEFSRSF